MRTRYKYCYILLLRTMSASLFCISFCFYCPFCLYVIWRLMRSLSMISLYGRLAIYHFWYRECSKSMHLYLSTKTEIPVRFVVIVYWLRTCTCISIFSSGLKLLLGMISKRILNVTSDLQFPLFLADNAMYSYHSQYYYYYCA